VADLHVLREHALGFAKARKVAFDWAEQVEKEFGMECTYEEGDDADMVQFKRSGVQGALQVTKDKFELEAKLGFLLGVFKDRIETEIVKMLDGMTPADAAAASAQPVAQAAVKSAPRQAAKKSATRKK
jgi:putative polyhydroxyalkanoate system protein